jgi:hypothetical protein
MFAEGARTNHFTAGFDLTFGWNFFSTVQEVFNDSDSATDLNASRASIYSQVPQGKSIIQYTTNHDETAWNEPPPELFGSLEASLAAFAATVVYGGAPLVYNGQELGMDENVPFFSRSPINWNTGQETAEWYSELLNIRQNHAALRLGSFDDESSSDVAMVLREHQGERVLVMINTRDHTSQIQVPVAWQGDWLEQFSGAVETLAAARSLDPYEVLVFTPAVTDTLGDFNDDGIVDAADYVVWRKNTGGTYTAADYNNWRANFGASLGSGANSQSVPEPGRVLHLVLAVVVVSLSRPAKSAKEFQLIRSR